MEKKGSEIGGSLPSAHAVSVCTSCGLGPLQACSIHPDNEHEFRFGQEATSFCVMGEYVMCSVVLFVCMCVHTWKGMFSPFWDKPSLLSQHTNVHNPLHQSHSKHRHTQKTKHPDFRYVTCKVVVLTCLPHI